MLELEAATTVISNTCIAESTTLSAFEYACRGLVVESAVKVRCGESVAIEVEWNGLRFDHVPKFRPPGRIGSSCTF
jgi:hypothetical protein